MAFSSLNLTSDVINDYLHDFNNLYAMRSLPIMVFLGILMLTGLIGNTLVCVLYWRRIKSKTPTRYFIISLAILDLGQCMVTIPLEIVDLRFTYTFQGREICWFANVFVTFSSLTSGVILLPIAAERYRKICQPFKPQMTPKVALICVIVCCVLSLLAAQPSGFLYGGRTVTTDNIYINGTNCALSDEYVGSLFHIGYLGGQFLLFLVATVTLTVLYTLIWCQLVRQGRFKKVFSTGHSKPQDLDDTEVRTKKPASNSEDFVTSGSTIDSLENHSSSLEICVGSGKTHILNNTKTDSRQSEQHKETFNDLGSICMSGDVSPYTSEDISIATPLDKSEENTSSCVAPHSTKDKSVNDIRSRTVPVTSPGKKMIQRMTLVFFLVTSAFVLSFLPYLCLTVLTSVRRKLIRQLTGAPFVAFQIFQRSYLLQSVSNPIIYSFFNPSFRNELRLLTTRRRMSKL